MIRVCPPAFSCAKFVYPLLRRSYATVGPLIIARPPPPVLLTSKQNLRSIDERVLAALRSPSPHHLPEIINQYVRCAGRVLDFSLPCEPSPTSGRRTPFHHGGRPEESGVAIIAHCVRQADKHKITLCPGFAVESAEWRVFSAHLCTHPRRGKLLLKKSASIRRILLTTDDTN